MASIKYITDPLGFIVERSQGPVPVNGIEISAEGKLEPLYIRHKGYRTHRYRVVDGKVTEQALSPYLGLVGEGDVISVFVSGNLEEAAEEGQAISLEQYEELLKEGGALPNGLVDQEFNLPLYHFKGGKVSKKRNLFDTQEKCEKALGVLNEKIEGEVAGKFSNGQEMKITKGYMAWMMDGKPKKDDREKAYLEMEKAIQAVKDKYKEQKDKIKASLAKIKK